MPVLPIGGAPFVACRNKGLTTLLVDLMTKDHGMSIGIFRISAFEAFRNSACRLK